MLDKYFYICYYKQAVAVYYKRYCRYYLWRSTQVAEEVPLLRV